MSSNEAQEWKPKSERDQREHALLEEMQAAELAYRQTVIHSRASIECFRNLPLGHPDGELARRQATRAEAAALGRYQMAVKAFSEWVLQEKPPAW